MIKSSPVIMINLACIYHYVPCFSSQHSVYSNNMHAYTGASSREYPCVCMYTYLHIVTHVVRICFVYVRENLFLLICVPEYSVDLNTVPLVQIALK